MMPIALVTHKTRNRIRLRIPSRRRDGFYFDALARRLSSDLPDWAVDVNILTGSVLIKGEALEIDPLIQLGRKHHLFSIESDIQQNRSVALSVTAPLHSADRQIKQVTGGRIDLTGAIFISLLVYGIIELIRGNWRSPPWYTAFWYAFGLYSKSWVDNHIGAVHVDPDGD